MRSASLILLALLVAACSQTLQPASNAPQSGVPNDFFWPAASLDSGMSYSISRNGSTQLHSILSKDDKHVFDLSIGGLAFRIVSRGDTIAIDSLGSNSLFSLPQGFFFARDTMVTISLNHWTYDTLKKYDTTTRDTLYIVDSTKQTSSMDTLVQRPGALILMVAEHLTKNDSWYAGKIAGNGLGNGLEITGHVVDHMDSLLLPTMQGVDSTSYGETYMIWYSHDSTKDSIKLPIFWKVYFTRNIGPVMIEEYLDSTASNTGKASLQSQARLARH